MAEKISDIPVPPDTVKQIVVNERGDMFVLSHAGRIFHRHKDEKHFGQGLPSQIWTELALPVLT